MDDFFEFIIFLITIIVVAGGIFWGIAEIAEAGNHDECHSKGDLAQIQVAYKKWDGCYVNQNGLWMPLDIWKYNRDHGIKMN